MTPHKEALRAVKRRIGHPVFSKGDYDIFEDVGETGTSAIVHHSGGRENRRKEIVGTFKNSKDAMEASIFFVEALHRSDLIWSGLCNAFQPGVEVGTRQDSFQYMVGRMRDES